MVRRPDERDGGDRGAGVSGGVHGGVCLDGGVRVECARGAEALALWSPYLLSSEKLLWAGQPDLRRASATIGVLAIIFFGLSLYAAQVAFSGASVSGVCGVPPQWRCVEFYGNSKMFFWLMVFMDILLLGFGYLFLSRKSQRFYAITSFRVLSQTRGLFAGLVELPLAGIKVSRRWYGVLKFRDRQNKRTSFVFLSKAAELQAYACVTQQESQT